DRELEVARVLRARELELVQRIAARLDVVAHAQGELKEVPGRRERGPAERLEHADTAVIGVARPVLGMTERALDARAGTLGNVDEDTTVIVRDHASCRASFRRARSTRRLVRKRRGPVVMSRPVPRV